MLAVLLHVTPPSKCAVVQLDKLCVPAGFHIEVYATVPGARSIAVSPNSGKYDIIYVGSMTDAQKVGA